MTKPYTLHHGDCIAVMRTLADNSVDAVVTDPPYGIRFMGKAWDGADIDARAEQRRNYASRDADTGPNGDHNSLAAEAGKYDLAPAAMRAFQEFSEEWAREAFRVLKPGGHLLSFASARTYHRMAAGIEDAGFEIRDQIFWLYGSGFPKSRNIGGGWGTALKPAHEPICVARKPLVGTVAANVLAHGTGALNIDGCRVGTESTRRPVGKPLNGGAYGSDRAALDSLQQVGGSDCGRWPANLIHDGSDEVLALFPAEAGASAPVRGTEASAASVGLVTGARARVAGAFHGDKGSAARFFYCAKASRADRNEGMENPGPQLQRGNTLRKVELAAAAGELKGNVHPTVKPTDLMAYLCRLVTPPGGLVLDPFMGSGSTGKAAMREGFRFVGIELDTSYLEIAQARIEAESEEAIAAAAPPPQADMFGSAA